MRKSYEKKAGETSISSSFDKGSPFWRCADPASLALIFLLCHKLLIAPFPICVILKYGHETTLLFGINRMKTRNQYGQLRSETGGAFLRRDVTELHRKWLKRLQKMAGADRPPSLLSALASPAGLQHAVNTHYCSPHRKPQESKGVSDKKTCDRRKAHGREIEVDEAGQKKENSWLKDKSLDSTARHNLTAKD